MRYISTRFCEIITNGIKVIEQTRFLYLQSYRVGTISILKITKGNNSAKNEDEVIVVNLCTLSGHALYLCQVS